MIFGTEPGTYDLAVFKRLEGYLCVCDDGAISVPFIQTSPKYRGQGYCKAFLNELPRDRPVIFPCVISPQLEGMLKRRGFQECTWWNPDHGEWDYDAMVRLPPGYKCKNDLLGGVPIAFPVTDPNPVRTFELR